MRDLVLVKLGGSLLTDKRAVEAVRGDVLERIAGEVVRGAAASCASLVLGHGAGSFGHVAAEREGVGAGPVGPDALRGIAAIQDASARLHRRVVGALLDAGGVPFSLPPSSVVRMRAGRVASLQIDPLLAALDRGLLPVLHGDVVLDVAWSAAICSTETALLAAAARLARRGRRVRRALWVGATAGLLDDAGRTVPRVRVRDGRAALAHARGADGTDVTGGMRHRLEAALALARRGVPSLILDGRVPGALEAALAGGEVAGATEIEP